MTRPTVTDDSPDWEDAMARKVVAAVTLAYWRDAGTADRAALAADVPRLAAEAVAKFGGSDDGEFVTADVIGRAEAMLSDRTMPVADAERRTERVESGESTFADEIRDILDR